jgi:dihydroxy-acid dehydratase
MALARLDIPAILVTGGPMMPGRFQGQLLALPHAREAVGRFRRGELTAEEFNELEGSICPGPGSCAMMGTANSTSCVTEVMGLSLPGCGTAHAVDAKKLRLAYKAGGNHEGPCKDLRPSKILTPAVLQNAITAEMALGGSSNLVLHLMALAYELNIPFLWKRSTRSAAGRRSYAISSPAGSTPC